MKFSIINEPEIERLILEAISKIDSLAASPTVDTPWFTTQEAASYLRCSPRKIEQLSSAGHLPYRRLDPTRRKSPRLYHRKHLAGYIVSGKNTDQQHLTGAEIKQVDDLL